MKRFWTKLAVSTLLVAMVVPTAGSRCSDRYGYGDYFDFDFGFDAIGAPSFFTETYVEEYDTFYDGGYDDDGFYEYEEYSDLYYDGWKGKKPDKR